MLDENTYSLESGEWQEVVNQYLQLEADALRQYNSLPASYHDAYRQIILFPIELMSNLHQMYFAQAQNHALYKQGNPKANVWADECERLFKRDSIICDYLQSQDGWRQVERHDDPEAYRLHLMER